jgi:hypothetical protein
MKCVWRGLTRETRATVSGARKCRLFCFSLASNGRHPRQSIMKRLMWRDTGMKGDVPYCRFSTINRVTRQSVPPHTYFSRFNGSIFSRFIFWKFKLNEYIGNNCVLDLITCMIKWLFRRFGRQCCLQGYGNWAYFRWLLKRLGRRYVAIIEEGCRDCRHFATPCV